MATGGGPNIHVPGSTRAGQASTGISSDDQINADTIDIVVYFADKSGIQLKVKDGQNMEAGVLFEHVLDDLDLQAEDAIQQARELFSLWLVSDLLELQLKPTHIPFKLVCYWEELLEKYTNASEENQQRDEPVIMFRRNVFYNKSLEYRVKDKSLLRYLYHEAKKNVIDGRYPLQREQCDELAILQTSITYKELEEESNQESSAIFGSAEYFKSNLAEYLPVCFRKRNLILHRSNNPEWRLAQLLTDRRQTYQSSNVHELYEQYLVKCREKFFYGSAYFRGQAEHPGRKIDDPVYIAVNVDGVSIIDLDDQVLLLSLPFEKLSWQYAESKSGSPTALPCLFLQFPYTEENRTEVSKLLQVFSKEALLADNIIEACITLKKIVQQEHQVDGGGDSVDGGGFRKTGSDEVDVGVGEISKQFQRLALITFDKSGKTILNNNIRAPKTVRRSTASNV